MTSAQAFDRRANGDDLTSLFTSLEQRVRDLERATSRMSSNGTWYSTSTATVNLASGEITLSSWTPVDSTPTSVTVAGDAFVINDSGRYTFTAQMFAGINGVNGTTGSVGFSIKNVIGSVLYAYTFEYFSKDANITAALLNCSSPPLAFSAGSAVKVFVFCPYANGITMAGTAANLGVTFGFKREN